MTELTPESTVTERQVPEGIQRARAAFLRDFPTLIANRATRGKYVCYHNDTRVTVAKTYRAIIQAAIALNIPENASLIFTLVPETEIWERICAVEGEIS